MSLDVAIAPVRKNLIVQTNPQHAFDTFTAGIDRWWPKHMSIGESPVKRAIIEPKLGGRWYTEHEGGEIAVSGHVLVWEPPRRIIFSWEVSAGHRPEPNCAYASEVEVRFTPKGEGTLVELEHRKFECMPGDGGSRLREAVQWGWDVVLEPFAAAADA